MSDYYVVKATTYRDRVDANEETVFLAVRDNPGSTLIDVETITGLPHLIVTNVVSGLEDAGILHGAEAFDGSRVWFTAPAWTSTIAANLAAARTWLDTHDAIAVSIMAADLGLHHAVAVALAFAMEREGRAKLIPTDL